MPAACPFCRIVAGAEPAHEVLRDDHVVAFLDVRPVFEGHVLVVPRRHVEVLTELPGASLAVVFGAVRRIAAAVEGGFGADGTFVAINNRVSQSVPHLHVHVVPRHRRDGLRGFFWPRRRYDDEAHAEAIATRLRAALDAVGDLP